MHVISEIKENDKIIYRIYHKISGKSYIGKCAKGLTRVRSHFTNYSNIKLEYRATLLYRAMRKYGVKEFAYDVVFKAESIKELNDAEKYFIHTFDSRKTEKGYNIRHGGDGGDMTAHYTPEQKKEYSEKLSKAMKANYTEERKKAASLRLKKIRANPEKSKRNREMSSERMKIMNKDPKFHAHRCKKVVNMETGIIYNSVKEAAASAGLKYGCLLGRLLRGSDKNWKYFGGTC